MKGESKGKGGVGWLVEGKQEREREGRKRREQAHAGHQKLIQQERRAVLTAGACNKRWIIAALCQVFAKRAMLSHLYGTRFRIA